VLQGDPAVTDGKIAIAELAQSIQMVNSSKSPLSLLVVLQVSLPGPGFFFGSVEFLESQCSVVERFRVVGFSS
jgi:hypothetical protein